MSRLPSKAELGKILLLQKDRLNCVPIGIYSLLKLSGASIWKKDIRKLKIILNVNRKTKGCGERYRSVLAAWAWRRKLKSIQKRISIRKIDQLLEKGPLLLGFIHEDDGFYFGHVSIVLKKTKGGRYLVNNWFVGRKFSLLEEKDLLYSLNLSKKFQKGNKGSIVYPHIDYIEGNISWL